MKLLRDQLALQREVFGVDPRLLRGADRVKYVRYNVLAAIVELVDMLDEVNGWKAWQESEGGDFKSDESGREFAHEGIDVAHHLANLLLVAGLNDYDFEHIFKQRHAENLRTHTGSLLASQVTHIPGVIADKLGVSRSDARRMIDTGEVKLDGAALSPGEHDAALSETSNHRLDVGRGQQQQRIYSNGGTWSA